MDNRALRIDKQMLKIKAQPKPSMTKPSTNQLAKYTTIALITKENRPKVRNEIGRLMSFKIGFKKIFKSPKTIAKIKAAPNPVKCMPLSILGKK